MYKKAKAKAQRAEQKKVGFNLQLPVGLKKDFEKLCKADGVSVTAMIISLIEVTLEESALAMEPLVEQSINSMKNILNEDNVFYPNPIGLDNPMYNRKVTKDEWKLLLDIYRDLTQAEHNFVSIYGPSDLVTYSIYQQNVINSIESTRRYIEQIAKNIKARKDIETVQDEIMDGLIKKLKKEGE